jgi:hypothetical protein
MRVQIIEILMEALVEEEVEVADIEECLDEFMETNFNTLSDEFSHTEMAVQLLRVRQELVFCAKNDLDLPSGSATLNNLREFNSKNTTNLDQMSQYMKQKRQEMDQAGDSDSDGFESVVSDGQCESYHSSDDDEDVEMEDTSKQSSK